MTVDLSEFDQEIDTRPKCKLCNAAEYVTPEQAQSLDAAIRRRSEDGESWHYPSVAILRRLAKWGLTCSESVMSKHRNNHL